MKKPAEPSTLFGCGCIKPFLCHAAILCYATGNRSYIIANEMLQLLRGQYADVFQPERHELWLVGDLLLRLIQYIFPPGPISEN